jgi:leucyl aminopeptidase
MVELELTLWNFPAQPGFFLQCKSGNLPSAMDLRYQISQFFRPLSQVFPFRRLVILSSQRDFRLPLVLAKDLVSLLEDCFKVNIECVFASEAAWKDKEKVSLLLELFDSNKAWVNENPDSMTSLAMGEKIGRFAESHGLTFRTLKEDDLEREGLVLLKAVGQASERSPSRLHIVEYFPKVDPVRPIPAESMKQGQVATALIGKGVTFDTGGVNLKHHDQFINAMKNDMGGSALAFHLFQYLVRTKHPAPLILLIPCCENSIDAKAQRPGTIYQTRSGKSVIVEHTDAEGRLILSDAMTYAQEHYNLRQMISFATLTTASMRQYSHFYTPLHFANQQWQSTIAQHANLWGEKFVFPEFFLPFLDGNNSKFADLTNHGSMKARAQGAAGSSVAAHFLKQFSKVPFLHFDIFASVWNWGEDYPGCLVGATGAPFMTLAAAFPELV